MDIPLVSVIILNYNGLKHLKECFGSLYNLNYKNIELILVDNNSQDKSVDFVRENYKNVRIIQLDKNYGFAQGNNLGVTHANGDYIVLLNMDTVVDKNWLSELVKVAEKSKRIGIVGGKIYYYDHKEKINFASSSNDKYGNTHHIGINKVDGELLDFQMKAFYICGAALLFKRELYEIIKLFDSTYFAYYEDVDFCWRAWISGYDVIYTPKAFIYHKIGRAVKNIKLKKYLLERNKLRTILKNYKLKSLIKILPGYLYQRLFEIFWLITHKSRFSNTLFIIYLKSILWNIFHIRSLIENRKIIQTHRKRDDKFIFQLMEELTEITTKVENNSKRN